MNRQFNVVAKRQPASTGLRLVQPGIPGLHPLPLQPVLRLRSFMAHRHEDGSAAALAHAFNTLATSEEVHFVHRMLSRDGLPYDYEFVIEVASPSHRATMLAETLRRAITRAFPAFAFAGEACGQADGPTATDWESHLPHAALLLPAGARLCARPAPSHVGTRRDTGWQCLPAADRDEGEAVVPFPATLPLSHLVGALAADADLPRLMELRLVVRRYDLCAVDQERAHRLVHRLEGGGLLAYHPDSPITPFSESASLSEKVGMLLRDWLRHPDGYALSGVVRSSEIRSDAALAQVGMELYGDQLPLRVQRVQADAWRDHSPAFWHAFRPTQGLPSLAPATRALALLGVAQHYPAPAASPPHAGARIGETADGRARPVALPFEARARHAMIVGASGSGKSSLMLNLCAADLQAEEPVGLVVIDPHGDLASRVLAMVPAHRQRDVIVIDVADATASVSLNPLEGMREDPHLAQYIVNEILSLVENLFESDHTTGPMLRSNLRHVLLLAAWTPVRQGTLLDAMRILEDSDYREYLLSKCKDRSVVEYWQRLEVTRGDHGFTSWVPYLMARLVPFVSNPVMKRLICRPQSTIDIAKAVNENAIIVVNLSRSVLQETECRVLGTLLLMKVFAAVQKRAHVPEGLRSPCHLYVDEAQSFATDAFPAMLAEGRKYGLCITTANQQLRQLRDATRRANLADALVSNTASKFLFRLGPLDQDMLAPYFRGQFDAAELGNLPDFHAVACMPVEHRPVPPFVLRVSPPDVVSTDGTRARDVADLSRRRHATPTSDANRELARFFDLSLASLGQKDAEA
jgi:hypothetical protein